MDDEDIIEEAHEVEHLLEMQEYDLYQLKKRIEQFLPVVLLTLVAVLYFEFFAHLPPRQHRTLLMIEWLILGYFVLEVAVDFALIESNRKFLRKKWLDIVLIIPFLSLLRQVSGVLKFFKVLKPAKPAKSAKSAKAGKAVKSAKLAKAKKPLKRTKKAQHLGKAMKKGKEFLEELLPGGD